MGAFFTWLDGKKTYLTAVVAAGLGLVQALGYTVPDYVLTVLGALGLVAVRSAISSTK